MFACLMPCLMPLLPCIPAVQLKASCYKKECIMLTIGTGGHTLGMNFSERRCGPAHCCWAAWPVPPVVPAGACLGWSPERAIALAAPCWRGSCARCSIPVRPMLALLPPSPLALATCLAAPATTPSFLQLRGPGSWALPMSCCTPGATSRAPC